MHLAVSELQLPGKLVFEAFIREIAFFLGHHSCGRMCGAITNLSFDIFLSRVSDSRVPGLSIAAHKHSLLVLSVKFTIVGPRKLG